MAGAARKTGRSHGRGAANEEPRPQRPLTPAFATAITHLCVCHRHDHLGAVLGDASRLVLASHHEAGDVLGGMYGGGVAGGKGGWVGGWGWDAEGQAKRQCGPQCMPAAAGRREKPPPLPAGNGHGRAGGARRGEALVRAWRKMRGMPRWLHSCTKCAPLSAASENRMPAGTRGEASGRAGRASAGWRGGCVLACAGVCWRVCAGGVGLHVRWRGLAVMLVRAGEMGREQAGCQARPLPSTPLAHCCHAEAPARRRAAAAAVTHAPLFATMPTGMPYRLPKPVTRVRPYCGPGASKAGMSSSGGRQRCRRCVVRGTSPRQHQWWQRPASHTYQTLPRHLPPTHPHTNQRHPLVPSTPTSPPTHLRLEFVEAGAIQQPRQHRPHIKGLLGVGRDHACQVVDRVGAGGEAPVCVCVCVLCRQAPEAAAANWRLVAAAGAHPAAHLVGTAAPASRRRRGQASAAARARAPPPLPPPPPPGAVGS